MIYKYETAWKERRRLEGAPVGVAAVLINSTGPIAAENEPNVTITISISIKCQISNMFSTIQCVSATFSIQLASVDRLLPFNSTAFVEDFALKKDLAFHSNSVSLLTLLLLFNQLIYRVIARFL